MELNSYERFEKYLPTVCSADQAQFKGMGWKRYCNTVASECRLAYKAAPLKQCVPLGKCLSVVKVTGSSYL